MLVTNERDYRVTQKIENRKQNMGHDKHASHSRVHVYLQGQEIEN